MHVPWAAYLFYTSLCKQVCKIIDRFYHHGPGILSRVALCFHVSLHPSVHLG